MLNEKLSLLGNVDYSNRHTSIDPQVFPANSRMLAREFDIRFAYSPSLVSRRCKRQDSDIACSFDGNGHLSLMLCAVPRDPSGNDLSPFRDEISKDLRVLIINIQFLIRTESADLSPHERLLSSVGACFLWGSPHSILLCFFNPLTVARL